MALVAVERLTPETSCNCCNAGTANQHEATSQRALTTELLFAAVIPEMLVPCTDDTDTVSEYLAIAETAVTTVLFAVCRSDLSGHQASCAVMCRSGRRVFFSRANFVH